MLWGPLYFSPRFRETMPFAAHRRGVGECVEGGLNAASRGAREGRRISRVFAETGGGGSPSEGCPKPSSPSASCGARISSYSIYRTNGKTVEFSPRFRLKLCPFLLTGVGSARALRSSSPSASCGARVGPWRGHVQGKRVKRCGSPFTKIPTQFFFFSRSAFFPYGFVRCVFNVNEIHVHACWGRDSWTWLGPHGIFSSKNTARCDEVISPGTKFSPFAGLACSSPITWTPKTCMTHLTRPTRRCLSLKKNDLWLELSIFIVCGSAP